MQGKRKLQRYVLTLGGVGRVGRVVQIGFQRPKLHSSMMMMMRSTVKIIMRIATAKKNKMIKCCILLHLEF